MLEWRGNLLWCDNHILADVVRFGPQDNRLDLRGWGGFGLCGYQYPTLRAAKAAAECWALSRAFALATTASYDDPEALCDDDIPF